MLKTVLEFRPWTSLLESHPPGYIFQTHTELAVNLAASADLALNRALLQSLLRIPFLLLKPGALAADLAGGETAAAPERSPGDLRFPRSLSAELRVALSWHAAARLLGTLPALMPHPMAEGRPCGSFGV